MGVAALDDATGIINYSLAIAVASVLILGQGFDVYSSLLNPLIVIVGGIMLGIAFGYLIQRLDMTPPLLNRRQPITFSRWREAEGPAPYKSPGGPEAC